MIKILLLIFSVFNVIVFTYAGDAGELSEKWKKWLEEEVIYIISSKERAVFLDLKTDREREAFRSSFWNQRDPTPGTEINEAKEEHYKRLAYANADFARGSFRPGWETDRGKIYIILGKPSEISRFQEGVENLLPSELWFYRSFSSPGLPSAFYILFYQDQTSADYKLYSPAFDGPQRLLRQPVTAYTDRFSAYQLLKGVSPELAAASLSLIPGSGDDPTSTTASLSSDIFISNVQNMPYRRVNTEWAEAFARSKELITTDYSVNYVQSHSALFIHQENGNYYLHYVIEPYQFEMRQNGQGADAALKLNATISDQSGVIIHQEEKDVHIRVNLDDLIKVERRIIAVGDLLPIVEGKYKVDFLLRNIESKAFSSIEETISIPPPHLPSLSSLLFLSNETKEAGTRDASVSFLIHDFQLYPNTQRIYSNSDDLIVFFEIYNPSPELQNSSLSVTIRDDNKVLFNQTEIIGTNRYFLKKYPLNGFSAGILQLLASVTGAPGLEIQTSKNEFQVTSPQAIPSPLNYNKVYPPLSHSYFSFIRARQYLALGKYDSVIAEIEAFYDRSNPNKDIAFLLSQAYFGKFDYEKAVAVLEPLKDASDSAILVLLGKSFFQLNSFSEAIKCFTRVLNSEGEVLELLNLLGFCYVKTDERKEAIDYFSRSIKLNPNQPDIKKIIDILEKQS